MALPLFRFFNMPGGAVLLKCGLQRSSIRIAWLELQILQLFPDQMSQPQREDLSNTAPEGWLLWWVGLCGLFQPHQEMISQRTVTETPFGPAHLRICKTWSLYSLRRPILKSHTGQGLYVITVVCTIHFLCNIYGKPQLSNYLCNMLAYCLNFP